MSCLVWSGLVWSVRLVRRTRRKKGPKKARKKFESAFDLDPLAAFPATQRPSDQRQLAPPPPTRCRRRSSNSSITAFLVLLSSCPPVLVHPPTSLCWHWHCRRCSYARPLPSTHAHSHIHTHRLLRPPTAPHSTPDTSTARQSARPRLVHSRLSPYTSRSAAVTAIPRPPSPQLPL